MPLYSKPPHTDSRTTGRQPGPLGSSDIPKQPVSHRPDSIHIGVWFLSWPRPLWPSGPSHPPKWHDHILHARHLTSALNLCTSVTLGFQASEEAHAPQPGRPRPQLPYRTQDLSPSSSSLHTLARVHVSVFQDPLKGPCPSSQWALIPLGWRESLLQSVWHSDSLQCVLLTVTRHWC